MNRIEERGKSKKERGSRGRIKRERMDGRDRLWLRLDEI